MPISTLEQKIALIEQAGIDILLVQDFNKEFSQLSPEQFIQAYLAGPLRTRSVCVGHNFRFGHQHRGNIETLRSSKEPFDVVEVPPVIVGAETISSSRVRQLLVEGRVRHARRMLGRCYEIEGAIVSGSGRGKKVTVPTLNLSPANKLIPAHGVYLTRVAVDGAPYAESLTNIGVRPTFQERERTIETHVLDSLPPEGAGFARLRILRRLRDERQFPDAAALREQIAGDAAFARRYFKRVGGLRETTTVAGSNTDTRVNHRMEIQMHSRPEGINGDRSLPLPDPSRKVGRGIGAVVESVDILAIAPHSGRCGTHFGRHTAQDG